MFSLPGMGDLSGTFGGDNSSANSSATVGGFGVGSYNPPSSVPSDAGTNIYLIGLGGVVVVLLAVAVIRGGSK